jgi:hypothetical protein
MRRILLMLLLLLAIKVEAQQSKEVYMFCYFKNNGLDGLHLAYSHDGYNWQALRNDSSVLKPEVAKDKLMRDPCIIRGADGLFHMVWTVSWTDKGIGYASSPDLIHWSQQQYIPVMAKEPEARNCWAPEVTYDKDSKTYMIYWATTITGRYALVDSTSEAKYNHRIYYVTTRDFKIYSDTKLLYDPGFNSIDATIIPDGKRFVMFFKDETRTPVQKNIKLAFADKLTGPYSKAGKPITGTYWAEGPTTLRMGKTWIVYFDRYRDHRYGALRSVDLLNWTDVSDEISLPKGIRHGTIFKITEKEFEQLTKNIGS